MTGSNKILIVEDYPDIATIYSYMLVNNGYTVQIARNGKEALAMYLSFKPDVMLLDIMLPDMDGTSVLSTIRSEDKYSQVNASILIMSNLLQDNIADKAKELGAVGYVVKANLQNEDIVAIVQELISRKSYEKSSDIPVT